MQATHALAPHLKNRVLLRTVFAANISPQSDRDQVDTGFAVLRELEKTVRQAEISAAWHELLSADEPAGGGAAEDNTEGGLALLAAMRAGRTPADAKRELADSLEAMVDEVAYCGALSPALASRSPSYRMTNPAESLAWRATPSTLHSHKTAPLRPPSLPPPPPVIVYCR
jgi:hypothetical protein